MSIVFDVLVEETARRGVFMVMTEMVNCAHRMQIDRPRQGETHKKEKKRKCLAGL